MTHVPPSQMLAAIFRMFINHIINTNTPSFAAQSLEVTTSNIRFKCAMNLIPFEPGPYHLLKTRIYIHIFPRRNYVCTLPLPPHYSSFKANIYPASPSTKFQKQPKPNTNTIIRMGAITYKTESTNKPVDMVSPACRCIPCEGAARGLLRALKDFACCVARSATELVSRTEHTTS